jgi:hypothetical protein
MAFLQERVIEYVTADPNLFLAEERLLFHGAAPNDHWWIDAMIVDPWAQMIYLGETTYNPRPPLLKKLKVFAERKSQVLQRIGRTGAPAGWDVRPWLFLRRDAVAWVVQRLPEGPPPKITYLEATAFPWMYEKLRAVGKEPDKPYSELDLKYQ